MNAPENMEIAGLRRDLEIMRQDSERWRTLCAAERAVRDDAAELLASIMRGEVNPEDEAEKWLRAYAPEHLHETS